MENQQTITLAELMKYEMMKNEHTGEILIEINTCGFIPWNIPAGYAFTLWSPCRIVGGYARKAELYHLSKFLVDVFLNNESDTYVKCFGNAYDNGAYNEIKKSTWSALLIEQIVKIAKRPRVAKEVSLVHANHRALALYRNNITDLCPEGTFVSDVITRETMMNLEFFTDQEAHHTLEWLQNNKEYLDDPYKNEFVLSMVGKVFPNLLTVPNSIVVIRSIFKGPSDINKYRLNMSFKSPSLPLFRNSLTKEPASAELGISQLNRTHMACGVTVFLSDEELKALKSKEVKELIETMTDGEGNIEKILTHPTLVSVFAKWPWPPSLVKLQPVVFKVLVKNINRYTETIEIDGKKVGIYLDDLTRTLIYDATSAEKTINPLSVAEDWHKGKVFVWSELTRPIKAEEVDVAIRKLAQKRSEEVVKLADEIRLAKANAGLEAFTGPDEDPALRGPGNPSLGDSIGDSIEHWGPFAMVTAHVRRPREDPAEVTQEDISTGTPSIAEHTETIVITGEKQSDAEAVLALGTGSAERPQPDRLPWQENVKWRRGPGFAPILISRLATPKEIADHLPVDYSTGVGAPPKWEPDHINVLRAVLAEDAIGRRFSGPFEYCYGGGTIALTEEEARHIYTHYGLYIDGGPLVLPDRDATQAMKILMGVPQKVRMDYLMPLFDEFPLPRIVTDGDHAVFLSPDAAGNYLSEALVPLDTPIEFVEENQVFSFYAVKRIREFLAANNHDVALAHGDEVPPIRHYFPSGIPSMKNSKEAIKVMARLSKLARKMLS